MQTDPEFDLDIKEDVEEECSKFGRVRHIYVDKYVLPTYDKYTASGAMVNPIILPCESMSLPYVITYPCDINYVEGVFGGWTRL